MFKRHSWYFVALTIGGSQSLTIDYEAFNQVSKLYLSKPVLAIENKDTFTDYDFLFSAQNSINVIEVLSSKFC